MIEYIRGELTEITPAMAVVEAAGVGYALNISLNTYTAIQTKKEVRLYVHEAIVTGGRDDSFTLYGFATKTERDLYRQLITVSGVGANTARMILSSLTPAELCTAITGGDERALKNVPDDETVLDGIKSAARFLKSIGLERYEISNYAVPGFECRHNLAVWRGEDYVGLGEGACGRIGLARTRNWWGQTPQNPNKHCGSTTSVETVSEKEDLKERTLFRLRTRDGIDSSRFPEWRPALDRFVTEGLLVKVGESVYRLTERGTEVCDAILEELV